jgi:hypothetical protein
VFIATIPIFESFKEVVNTGPSDRTANQKIFDPGDARTEDEVQKRKAALASALAGAAVGPVFPRFFAMQAVCGAIALVTAFSWWRMGRVHHVRVITIAVALTLVVVAWPISDEVSLLRVQRYNPDPAISDPAKAAFGPWHNASLLLSAVTVLLSGTALALAAKLPNTAVDSPEDAPVESAV